MITDRKKQKQKTIHSFDMTNDIINDLEPDPGRKEVGSEQRLCVGSNFQSSSDAYCHLITLISTSRDVLTILLLSKSRIVN